MKTFNNLKNIFFKLVSSRKGKVITALVITCLILSCIFIPVKIRNSSNTNAETTETKQKIKESSDSKNDVCSMPIVTEDSSDSSENPEVTDTPEESPIAEEATPDADITDNSGSTTPSSQTQEKAQTQAPATPSQSQSSNTNTGSSSASSGSSAPAPAAPAAPEKKWIPPVYKTVHHDAVYQTEKIVVCNYCGAEFASTGEFQAHKEANGG